MNPEITIQAKIECLKAALQYSSSFESLLENYQKLKVEILQSN